MSVPVIASPVGRDIATTDWPALPLGAWQETYATLHMWTQIVGKTRLALAPSENHWWQVALYVTPRGLTTSTMPARDDARTFVVDFDFLEHRLYVRSSDGDTRAMPLGPRTVADFYAEYRATLRAMRLDVRITPVPNEVEPAIPFPDDRLHASYDADAANRCWRVLAHTDQVLKKFRGRFQGKASPVHFFWGGFDMASTRFSGRPAPRYAGVVPNCPNYVMVEAYSRECSSCGFWPGGGPIAEPVFYAYAYPEPPGYAEHAVRADGAYYNRDMREFVLPYDIMRTAPSPEGRLLDFCQSTYEAAADLGGWDRASLDRPHERWP